MRKKLLSILALLCLTVSSAWAAVVDSGDCGTTGHESEVTWSLDDTGVLTISGTGAMKDYAMASDQPWMSYRNPSSGTKITSIVVEEGVTHIGNNAFMSCTNATSVSLPSSLTSIGDYAFRSCSNASLMSITIPDNVETIGIYAFAQTRLTTVTIGNSVTSIDGAAFYNCANLTSISIPASVTSIGTSAFRGCTGLTSIDLPANLTTIDVYAFYGCNNASLTSISIPASVTSIGQNAFKNCSNLATVTLNSNPAMGANVFNGIADGATVTMNLTANSAGGAKWATFYNKLYSFEADANTQVFKAGLSGTSITLYEVTDKIVDAGIAVVLKTTGGGDPVMTLTTSASGNSNSNSLEGVSDAAGLTAADPSTTYVLNYTAANGVGFYKLTSGKTLGVGKAYLTSSSLSRGFIGFGETTGIGMPTAAESSDADTAVYDLQGRRVTNPAKGLYIINGKKVLYK